MICPHCQSPKTMAIPDSSAFVCYACKLEFTPEKPFASLQASAEADRVVSQIIAIFQSPELSPT